MAVNNEHEALDSGGFGKDYHGQDVFGERIGGTGIGGDGHESSFDAPEIDTTELSNTESSFEGEANEVADSMRESIRGVNEETAENSNTDSTMDTSFQIGGIEEEDVAEKAKDFFSKVKDVAETAEDFFKDAAKTAAENIKSGEFSNNFVNDLVDGTLKLAPNKDKKGASFPDTPTDNSDWERAKSSFDVERVKEKEEERTKTSFTDKMKSSTDNKTTTESNESKPSTEAKADSNMSKATPGKSDYETKANKDSTKELPPSRPSRNDFGNHAVDTLKGAVDIIADNSTADALGLKSIEDFARENGYDPNKLSTLKAYRSYQNKEIWKAVPGIAKQVGGYIWERTKDVVDPSQLPERIRNTLARYNLATLIGAAILSIKSGAGLQASIDQALTMVDPEDQTAVSDYLEDVLSDEGTVADLSNAFDDALAPQQNSASNELDESIANIGRKDNTDYSGFNAGLGTTSDADVKVFIARNVKSDPILRRMISKMGK